LNQTLRIFISLLEFINIRSMRYHRHSEEKLFPSISISVSFRASPSWESVVEARSAWKIWMTELLELINLEQFRSKEKKREAFLLIFFFRFIGSLCFTDLSMVLSPVDRTFSNSQIAYLLTRLASIIDSVPRVVVIMRSLCNYAAGTVKRQNYVKYWL